MNEDFLLTCNDEHKQPIFSVRAFSFHEYRNTTLSICVRHTDADIVRSLLEEKGFVIRYGNSSHKVTEKETFTDFYHTFYIAFDYSRYSLCIGKSESPYRLSIGNSNNIDAVIRFNVELYVNAYDEFATPSRMNDIPIRICHLHFSDEESYYTAKETLERETRFELLYRPDDSLILSFCSTTENFSLHY